MHNYNEPAPLDPEYNAWLICDTEDLWIFDKLILSRKLGYLCGPAGVPVIESGHYCVRPAVNLVGYGLGTKRLHLNENMSTEHLEPGTFWCEWFDGLHRSVDYVCIDAENSSIGYKNVVVGTPSRNQEKVMSQWESWKKDPKDGWAPPALPDFLVHIIKKYKKVNIEYIGDKIIEVHLRHNPDFQWENSEYIPVFDFATSGAYGRSMNDQGYRYISDEGNNGRIGAWIR